MIKLNKKTISYILAFLMILNIGFFTNSVKAEGNKSINVKIGNYEDILKTKDGGVLDGVKFDYWKIGKSSDYEDFSEEDYKKLIEELKPLSNEQLDTKYGKSLVSPMSTSAGEVKIDNLETNLFYFREIEEKEKFFHIIPFLALVLEDGQVVNIATKYTEEKPTEEHGKVKLIKKSDSGKLLENVGFKLYKLNSDGSLEDVPLNKSGNYSPSGEKDVTLYTDKNGEIVVDGLPVGKYVFREVAPLEGYKIFQKDNEFVIEKNKTTELTVLNKKVPTEYGKIKFLKISDDSKKTPLEGAQFKVTKKIGDSFEDVLIDGKVYYVESDKDGKFVVENLPYGIYYLWETKAPKGFVQLASPIQFEINKDSDQKVLVITNKKKPPIEVPSTGDMMVMLILASSLVLFGTGFKLSKEN